MIFLVDIMVPNRDDRYQKVARSHQGVQDKKQEESLVFKAHAVIDKYTVCVHLENTSFTNRAVVCPRWLEVVALGALPVPEAPEVAHGLGSVFHESFNILLETFKPIIFHDGLCSARSWLLVTEGDLGSLTVFSVFDFFAELLVFHQVSGTTWLNDHGPKVVKNNVVEEREANRNPNKAEEHS